MIISVGLPTDCAYEYYAEFIFQVLEDPKTNWRLLREYFFETRAVHPLGSVMKSLHTDDGRAIQEAWLRHITATGNCPVVIAWDTEQEKVKSVPAPTRNQMITLLLKQDCQDGL